MPHLPTIDEIVKTLKRVRTAPARMARKECEFLFSILRASYDEDLEDQYDSLDNQYIDATEGAGNLQQDVIIAISQLPLGLANDIVSELITFLDSDPQFYELAHAMLAIAFPLTGRAVTALNEMQRDVLTAILANDAIWNFDLEFADCLKQRGLQNSRKEIDALLG